MDRPYAELCQCLRYTFTDPALLRRALTHRSCGSDNYERLEFLGDSVLNLAISADLYARYPTLSEGQLTRLRASLVRKSTLAGVARRLALGHCLNLGEGERRSGGHDRDSILADALEAVFGAVYVEAGLGEAARVVRGVFAEALERVDPGSISKDPKTELQEYLQRLSLPTPEYKIAQLSGKPHYQRFVVECRVASLAEPVRGEGVSRRAAEQAAAALALDRLAAGA